MSRFALVLLLSSALAVPALAQKKEEPKKDAAKVTIPKDTFFKGQTAGQYLAGEQFIGAKVTNKDGQTIGTISDLIVGSGEKIEGVVLGVGGFLGVGEKKVGVRIGALKITRSDGKLAISLPVATKEMLGALEPYQRAGAPPPKK
jgi:PRC-barrel domain